MVPLDEYSQVGLTTFTQTANALILYRKSFYWSHGGTKLRRTESEGRRGQRTGRAVRQAAMRLTQDSGSNTVEGVDKIIGTLVNCILKNGTDFYFILWFNLLYSN